MPRRPAAAQQRESCFGDSADAYVLLMRTSSRVRDAESMMSCAVKTDSTLLDFKIGRGALWCEGETGRCTCAGIIAKGQ